jgi:hypothetical protein
MRNFLQAVELRAWRDHEERIDSTPGSQLPKGGEGHHERSPVETLREQDEARLARRGERVRLMRADGFRLAEIAAELGCTERQALYAEKYLAERERKKEQRRRA